MASEFHKSSDAIFINYIDINYVVYFVFDGSVWLEVYIMLHPVWVVSVSLGHNGDGTAYEVKMVKVYKFQILLDDLTTD